MDVEGRMIEAEQLLKFIDDRSDFEKQKRDEKIIEADAYYEGYRSCAGDVYRYLRGLVEEGGREDVETIR